MLLPVALVHRVEAARPEHLAPGSTPDELRDLVDRLGRHPAVLLLREVQQAAAPPTRANGYFATISRALAHGSSGSNAIYRSTSPMIGSTLEMTATASATSRFSIIGAIAPRL